MPIATSEVDFFSLHTRKQRRIDVEMLDYGFVERCNDLDELKGILAMLRSGKEGRYPDLERATENRILDILPAKERKKIIDMRAGPSGLESAQEKEQLESWTQQMDEKHQALQEQRNRNRVLPPVRGQVQHKSEKAKMLITEVQPNQSRVKQAIPAYDFRAWEKYDVESAIQEIDLKDQSKLEQTRINREQQEQRMKDRKKEIASLPSYICLEELSMQEREVCALHEKQKGNESFKVNENEDAILYYTRSIAFDDTNAIVYANRAMAHLRMKNFAQAEIDCTRAITLDATYTKAWTRRGMTRVRRGKYADAIADFERVLTLEPNNKEVEKLLCKTRTKWKEIDGTIDDNQASNDIGSIATSNNVVEPQANETKDKKTFTRLEIVEDEDEDEDDDANDPSNNNFRDRNEIEDEKPFQRFEILED